MMKIANTLKVNKVSITSYLWDLEQEAKLSELQISYLWTRNNNTLQSYFYRARYIKVANIFLAHNSCSYVI